MLVDDLIAVVRCDKVLSIKNDVAGRDDEAVRMLTGLAVLVDRNGQLRLTADARALANDLQRVDLRMRQFGDPLVHFAEESFVAGEPRCTVHGEHDGVSPPRPAVKPSEMSEQPEPRDDDAADVVEWIDEQLDDTPKGRTAKRIVEEVAGGRVVGPQPGDNGKAT